MRLWPLKLLEADSSGHKEITAVLEFDYFALAAAGVQDFLLMEAFANENLAHLLMHFT